MKDIIDRAKREGRDISDVLAEELASCLMSGDSDPTHIHWLTFQEQLEDYIKRYNNVSIS